MVAPTWRRAEISAEPEPLRSADRADRAAFIVCGIARPRPRPNRANQAAANPVPLLVLVMAPTARVAAMRVNPIVTSPFTLASGARGAAIPAIPAVPVVPGSAPAPGAAARRGDASRVLLIMPTT